MTEKIEMDRKTAAATARMIEGLWDLQTMLNESESDALQAVGGVLGVIIDKGKVESIANVLYDITFDALHEDEAAAEYKWIHGAPFGELKQ